MLTPHPERVCTVTLSDDSLINSVWALEDAANEANADNRRATALVLLDYANEIRKSLMLDPVSLRQPH